jgi:O-antigen/teichoic acid export membrane protein
MGIQNNSKVHALEVTTIAKGAGIVFIGTIIGTGLKYLFELIVARNLGPNLFGIFFLGFTIFKILEKVSTVGLHNGVLRYVSLFRGIKDEQKIKGTILLSLKIVLITGVSIALLMIIFSSTISSNLFHNIDLSSILKIFGIMVIFTALTEILIYSTQAFQIMKYKVLVRMIYEPGVRILLLIIFFILGLKLFGAVFAFLISIITGTFLAFYYLKKIFPSILIKKISATYETKNILNFSWPLFVAGFFNLIIIHINTLMLGHFRTSQEVGLYGAAQRTSFLIPVILESFNAIFAPIIADFYNRKELEKLENLFKIVTKWIFTISFPVFLIIVFFAKEILNLWGKEYTTGAIYLIVICFAQLINCSVGSVGYMIMMTGRTKINLLNTIIIFAMTITLNLFLIPKYGVLGAALSLAIAIGTVNIIRLIEVYLILRIHPYRIDFLKPLGAGIISFILLFIISKYLLHIYRPLIFLFVGSLLFIITYALIVSLLGIGKEDRIILEKIRAKLNIKGEK